MKKAPNVKIITGMSNHERVEFTLWTKIKYYLSYPWRRGRIKYYWKTPKNWDKTEMQLPDGRVESAYWLRVKL